MPSPYPVTWAPRAHNRCAYVCPAVASTRIPRRSAICTAAKPMVVPAPWIRIVFSGSKPRALRCQKAVSTVIGSAAACTRSRPSGTRNHRFMTARSDAPADEQCAQSAVPNTTSPILTSVTPSPTASMVPETSHPIPRGRSPANRPPHSAQSAPGAGRRRGRRTRGSARCAWCWRPGRVQSSVPL